MAKVVFDSSAFPPNNHLNDIPKSEEEPREKLEPIVKKDAVVSTKKTLGRKFVDTFISDDVKDVKSYVFLDVIVPTIKNTLLDVIEMIFFGGVRNRSGYRSRLADRVSYSSYYKSDYDDRRRDFDRRRDSQRYYENTKVDYRNIILKNRRDAEEVVDELCRRIKEYRQTSIADLYDLIDVTSSYVDNNWGWTDVADIGIRRVSSGYLIDVAEARYLD